METIPPVWSDTRKVSNVSSNYHRVTEIFSNKRDSILKKEGNCFIFFRNNDSRQCWIKELSIELLVIILNSRNNMAEYLSIFIRKDGKIY